MLKRIDGNPKKLEKTWKIGKGRNSVSISEINGSELLDKEKNLEDFFKRLTTIFSVNLFNKENELLSAKFERIFDIAKQKNWTKSDLFGKLRTIEENYNFGIDNLKSADFFKDSQPPKLYDKNWYDAQLDKGYLPEQFAVYLINNKLMYCKKEYSHLVKLPEWKPKQIKREVNSEKLERSEEDITISKQQIKIGELEKEIERLKESNKRLEKKVQSV